MEKIIRRPNRGTLYRLLGTAAAIAGALALPQVFHFIGAAAGLGPALGETFLPMHLPVILAGMLLGPAAGLIVGLASPILSYAISGMPAAAILPFMTVELAAYGLWGGIFKSVKLALPFKLAAVQIGGRLTKAAALAIASAVLGSKIAPASVLTATVNGLPGLLLQWILVPLIVVWVGKHATAR